MKLKKMICGLAAIVTMFSACTMPVSAEVMWTEPSFMESYDFIDYNISYDIDGNIHKYPVYHVYEDEFSGRYYDVYGPGAVIITAEKDTDIKPLLDLLGEPVNTDENQFTFAYKEDFDYESLYEFENVEKVYVTYNVGTSEFLTDSYFAEDDIWAEANNADANCYTKINIIAESESELTEDLFDAAGIEIEHIYKTSVCDPWATGENTILWYAYYKNTGTSETAVNFINEAVKIEGIVAAIPDVGYLVGGEDETFAKEIANLIGDANGDGIVNIADLILMKNYLLENISAENLNFSKSDLNKDGDLSASDYASVKKRMIK